MTLRFERYVGRTRFIRLDAKQCSACWKCLERCSAKVIGRVNLPWHKHARLRNVEACTGCLKCVRICESGALVKNSTSVG